MKAWIAIAGLFLAVTAFSAPEEEPKQKVRYRSAAEINFDSLELHGGVARPDLAVVTGDTHDWENGLLRMRENFLDKLAKDSAEEIQ